MGYSDADVDALLKHIDEQDTIEGAEPFHDEHLPVFDCAFKAVNGVRSIHYRAHLKMMAAVQPFLSGAISKTVNMPEATTVEEIMETYLEGWQLGLKAVAVYRDGSKRTQPLSTNRSAGKSEPAATSAATTQPAAADTPFRRRMPQTRQSVTHKFDIAGHEGYLTVGCYEDGLPGELFITMAKEGSTVGGIMDSFGTAISLCLQYGVPVQELCRKFSHSRFEPSGFTKNPSIPIAKSIVDYIFRWLAITFPAGALESMLPLSGVQTMSDDTKGPAVDALGVSPERVDGAFAHFMEDAPVCDLCGSITVRNGACYRCHNCGNSLGCS
ncbi:MAG: hypothetical protein O3A51_14445 [Verrucomicrobia bacterium]|nr:hypothetical protein [Verrucomicrobiota bacterium]